MPSQSGASTVLKHMRRGYTREAFMELIDDAKSIISDVSISFDFIIGYLWWNWGVSGYLVDMDYVIYDQAFMFAYSMRENTCT